MTQTGEWNLRSELVPSTDEAEKILKVIKGEDEKYYTLFAFLFNAGFRISEGIHVKVSDLVNGRVRIVRRKKHTLKPSTVELSDWVWKLLTKWAEGKKGYLWPGDSAPCILARSNGRVEQICKGGHLHIRTAQTRWRFTIAKCGLYEKGRGIHQTRHYFATQLYTETRNIRAVQQALDHSSVDMSAKYAHVVDMHEQVNKMRPTT